MQPHLSGARSRKGLLCLLAAAALIAAASTRTEAASSAGNTAMNLYISPSGNDSWSGRLANPNRSRTDGPFATLERARDAVRALKRSNGLPKGGVTIHLRAGVYSRASSFTLTEEDSATADSPITYRAYRREKVVLSGGREIGGFTPVTDPAVLERLDPAARGNVLQTDLRAQGISDFGRMTRRGFGQAIVPAGLELFFQDRPMQLARWPNGDEWTKIVAAPAGQEGGKFTYAGDRPSRWKSRDDIWVHGYWTYDWADTYEKVKSLDTAQRMVETEPPHGVYGYSPGKRFYFLNILEELDSPGEWYLDRQSGILYFWSPAPLDQGKTVVSLLEAPLLSLEKTSHITFQGLVLECSRGPGAVIVDGAYNRIAGCTLRNLGTFAVSIGGNHRDYQTAIYNDSTLNRQAGAQNGVLGCDIYQTGDGGILLGGGDRKTLTMGGNYAVNNHIHNYSRWSRTYRAAVTVDGVGNRVAHNLIHDAPHNAILLGGNEHLIEYNEIYRVCLQTGDAGAFYMGRDFTMRGNVIRHNYFHHITRLLEGGGGFVDVMAVYLDDCASGTTVFGNLFYRAGRAAMIGGGRDNTIENNIFVECTPAVHVDGRGLGWAKFWFDGRDSTLMDRLKAVQHDQPPYSLRYPALANILQDDPAVPKGNRILRNVRAGGTWLEMFDNLNDRIVLFENNFTEGDPRFVSLEKRDFRLKPDSPVWKLGFKAIPVEKIGLYKDAYRTALPKRDPLP